tara:strand:+ start:60 stop:458 length:399 start_codon:yes stop_codon:yes gene_type:complete
MISGSGNTVNPTGIGKSLNIIGDFAYAYSGTVTSDAGSSADKVLLEFTTGNFVLECTLSCQSDETGGATEFFVVELDSQKIVNASWDNSASSNTVFDFPLPLIIPPHSKVKILGGASNQDIWTAQIVGRIYT